MNIFHATVINTTNQPVTGHVRFEIKEYGYVYSDVEEVEHYTNYEKTFGASFETEKIIDESYLIGGGVCLRKLKTVIPHKLL